jgi:hypothetical protein
MFLLFQVLFEVLFLLFFLLFFLLLFLCSSSSGDSSRDSSRCSRGGAVEAGRKEGKVAHGSRSGLRIAKVMLIPL